VKTLPAKVIGISICVLSLASSASSKAPLSKLIISGGSLVQPVVVSNDRLMQSSNPWFGTFIPFPQPNQVSQQTIATPPANTPRYKISFYATFRETQPHVVYVVYYTFDPATRRGFVYLPGPHDSEYYTNAGSIMRPNQDGRWNLADADWCDQINEIISHAIIR
jgi:hypothetical protein